jgi:hypothetical protein
MAGDGSIPDAARDVVARYPVCFVASLDEDGAPNQAGATTGRPSASAPRVICAS